MRGYTSLSNVVLCMECSHISVYSPNGSPYRCEACEAGSKSLVPGETLRDVYCEHTSDWGD
jgi:hypothetical protein